MRDPYSAYAQQQSRARAVRAKRRRRARALRRGLFGLASLLVCGAVAVVLLCTAPQVGAALPPAVWLRARQERIVVAVDPGHGGQNPASGWDCGAQWEGRDEATLTLRTARELVRLLEADGRFAPVLTADGSAYLKGSERGAAAKNAGAQLLLSIHFNSDPSCSARGFECYPATPALPTNAQSLRFAGLLAENFAAVGAPLRGENGVRYLYYDDDGKKQICESSDTTSHGVQTFGVLEHCGCPAVLAEQCFLTSDEDMALFGQEAGCRAAAELYYAAICRYFEEETP